MQILNSDILTTIMTMLAANNNTDMSMVYRDIYYLVECLQ